MKALEFEGRLANRDHIQLPHDVADQIPEGAMIRVILLIRPDTGSREDDSWNRFSRDRFGASYIDEDAVYEGLMNEPSHG